MATDPTQSAVERIEEDLPSVYDTSDSGEDCGIEWDREEEEEELGVEERLEAEKEISLEQENVEVEGDALERIADEKFLPEEISEQVEEEEETLKLNSGWEQVSEYYDRNKVDEDEEEEWSSLRSGTSKGFSGLSISSSSPQAAGLVADEGEVKEGASLQAIPPGRALASADELSVHLFDEDESDIEAEIHRGALARRKEQDEGNMMLASSSGGRPTVSDFSAMDEREYADLHASALRRQVSRLENMIIATQQGPMTATQLNRFHLYLGSMGELMSILETLIEKEIVDLDEGNAERLMTYLELHERLNITVSEFASSTAQQREMAFARAGDGENNVDFVDANLLAGRHVHLGAGFESVAKDEEKPVVKECYGEGLTEVPECEGETESIDCPICMTDFEFPTCADIIGPCGEGHRLFKCKHLYCQECVYTYLRTAIVDGKVEKIMCPDPTCDIEIPEEELEMICGPTLFAKYQKFVVLKQLRSDPNTRWCPNPLCESGVQGGSAEQRRLTCPTCAKDYCWVCNQPWHDGISCKKATKQSKKLKGCEKKGDKWIRKHTKPCPNCQIAIVKRSGCNHMKCHNCQHDFCWICMQTFEGYNHFSRGKCKGKMYYSSRVKKAAVYTGVGVGVFVGVVIAAPFALVALPIYGTYLVLRAVTS